MQAQSIPAANEALQDLLWNSDVTDLSHMLLEPRTLPLLLDLNDANQTFEVLHGHSIAELQHAPATVIPVKPKVCSSGPLCVIINAQRPYRLQNT